jgi:CubicO group peptidase (beta-lactamase class C family)
MHSDRRTFLLQVGLGLAGVGLPQLVTGCRSIRPGAAAQLPRGTPESQGLSSQAILDFLAAAARQKYELHSLMLLRHGHVVAEGWWAPYAPALNHTLYSMSKSFTSTAVGFAVSEGRFSVDDKVVKFFPGELPAEVTPNLAALRVKDLLSMSVGNEKEPTQEMVNTDNWVRSFLAAPITHRPGSVFMYNSAATYMCSAIVQRLTGQRIVDYLKPRLFDSLDISGPTWETCPRGIDVGGWGLSIRTEGLARFGQLLLQQGQWRGRQIIPARWVEEATTFKIQQPLPANPGRPNDQNDWLQGYCYQFWRSTHNSFRGDGAFGQFTLVMPDQDAVVIMTAESNNLQGQLDLVWEHLWPAMKGQPMPENASLHAQLQQQLSSLTLQPPTGKTSSTCTGAISGKPFTLQNNSLKLDRVTFHFGKDACLLTFTSEGTPYPIPCGLEAWKRGETGLPGTPPRLISGGAPKAGTPFKVAASGTWKSEDTFEVTLRYYETPHRDTLTCRFEGNQVSISFMNSLAAMSAKPVDKRPDLRGRLEA